MPSLGESEKTREIERLGKRAIEKEREGEREIERERERENAD